MELEGIYSEAAAEGLDAAELESLLVVAPAAVDFPVSPEESVFTSFGAAGLPEFLKSVAYQPVPFNWKAAAVSCFFKLSSPHSGHVSKGESLIFWIASME